jgi:hypothetical protein
MSWLDAVSLDFLLRGLDLCSKGPLLFIRLGCVADRISVIYAHAPPFPSPVSQGVSLAWYEMALVLLLSALCDVNSGNTVVAIPLHVYIWYLVYLYIWYTTSK